MSQSKNSVFVRRMFMYVYYSLDKGGFTGSIFMYVYYRVLIKVASLEQFSYIFQRLSIEWTMCFLSKNSRPLELVLKW